MFAWRLSGRRPRKQTAPLDLDTLCPPISSQEQLAPGAFWQNRNSMAPPP